MKLHRIPLAVAALALAATLFQAGTEAAEPAAPGPALSQAFSLFDRARKGESGDIEAAAQQFQALSDASPADPVLRAYAGAATAMRASTTLLPWRKMGHAEDGLALLDKALAQLSPAHDAPLHRGVPAALETRFVAANTFLALPAMFNRGARGQALLVQVQGSPLLAGAPQPFRDSVAAVVAQQGNKQATKAP